MELHNLTLLRYSLNFRRKSRSISRGIVRRVVSLHITPSNLTIRRSNIHLSLLDLVVLLEVPALALREHIVWTWPRTKIVSMRSKRARLVLTSSHRRIATILVENHWPLQPFSRCSSTQLECLTTHLSPWNNPTDKYRIWSFQIMRKNFAQKTQISNLITMILLPDLNFWRSMKERKT